MSHITEENSTCSEVIGSVEESQTSLILASEASRNEENISYKIYTEDIPVEKLERWQVEKEMGATKLEEKRLRKALKKITWQHTLNATLYLEGKHSNSDQYSYDVNNFSKKWRQLYIEFRAVMDHLDILEGILESFESCIPENKETKESLCDYDDEDGIEHVKAM